MHYIFCENNLIIMKKRFYCSCWGHVCISSKARVLIFFVVFCVKNVVQCIIFLWELIIKLQWKSVLLLMFRSYLHLFQFEFFNWYNNYFQWFIQGLIAAQKKIKNTLGDDIYNFLWGNNWNEKKGSLEPFRIFLIDAESGSPFTGCRETDLLRDFHLHNMWVITQQPCSNELSVWEL